MEQPIRIEVDKGTRVILTWEGGSRSVIPAPSLRAACLCADCRSEAGARRKEAVLRQPDDISIGAASLVGAYAVNFEFQPDRHRTGIFTFDQLWSLGSPPA